MKLNSIISSSTAIVVSTIAVPQSLHAQNTESRASGKFYCGINYNDNNPATLVKHPNRGEITFINWKSNYFEASGWTPQKRCEAVSKRFQNYQEQGVLTYIVPDTINGYPVLCAARTESEGCQERLLFTLQLGTDQNDAIKAIYNLNIDANSDPLDQEAGGLLSKKSGKLVLHLDSFLEVAPENTSTDNTPCATRIFGPCN